MGSTDPSVAEEWIKSLESIFSYLHMEDADKVTCAIFLLTKHARIWWESASVALPARPLTWDTFKSTFYNKYFSKDVRAKKASDFLNLKQGTMSMAEYIQQFEAGVQYAPYIAHDDTSKGEHFMRGLRFKFKRDVRMSKVVTYGEIVERALMAEQDEPDIDRDRQQQRQQYFQKSQGTGQGKKTDSKGTRPEEHRGKGPPPRKEKDRPPCPKCGKLHGGECVQGSNVCYRCKKPGHLARNCPGSSEKVQGRLFSMIKEEVDADTSMITASTTETQLAIALPSGQELQADQIVRGCQIYVQGHQMYAELIVLKMTDFDVILGMDWLSKCRVTIDCGIKMIKFALVGAEPFTVASADTNVVCEFPEVFLDDVTGLPPDREIEFVIDVKNVKFVWNKACDHSFQELKAKLTSAPVLAIPEGPGDFVIYSDASKQGLGAVLMQHGKISPLKGILRFGKKGKLSPRYIGPFEILERIGDKAYRVALPPNLSNVHNVFSCFLATEIFGQSFSRSSLRTIGAYIESLV
ncbi:uncharacterized protein LOC142537684 [Primulina tabacum]|uniref:uncharacterized protein LOC142537684 n=1 Tax=Primulina tabacum TaxID=48773 RepID=UPI003F5A2B14